MINTIKTIFCENGYNERKSDDFLLFEYSKEDKRNYYIVIELDPREALLKQNDIYEKCREVIVDKSFDKNCSMIILYKIQDSKSFKDIKEDILLAEENPYLFKKQVLYYREANCKSLIEDLKSEEIITPYISKLISDTSFFSQYKENHEHSKESLVFRIFSKLPFLKVQTSVGETLDSLFEKNDEALKERSLKQLNNNLFDIIKDLEVDDIESNDLFSKLEEMSSGD